ncbi:uncharacterized protein C8Q71DRAFT_858051 [Rhodofomes roseus]|uniref:Uncharacterized protein n=1 Tax=Rhodofomes roseus TaxID=34475 RepID=A0ABQ8KHS7_9APHY|nr:uncharacterized protein C8Q71DRAFT_858051 [Rhodofomes roseus]KAH9836854.1 hypothetical protein C8Q71DRAFT_858051 [Rhodofomes roseus]
MADKGKGTAREPPNPSPAFNVDMLQQMIAALQLVVDRDEDRRLWDAVGPTPPDPSISSDYEEMGPTDNQVQSGASVQQNPLPASSQPARDPAAFPVSPPLIPRPASPTPHAQPQRPHARGPPDVNDHGGRYGNDTHDGHDPPSLASPADSRVWVAGQSISLPMRNARQSGSSKPTTQAHGRAKRTSLKRVAYATRIGHYASPFWRQIAGIPPKIQATARAPFCTLATSLDIPDLGLYIVPYVLSLPTPLFSPHPPMDPDEAFFAPIPEDSDEPTDEEIPLVLNSGQYRRYRSEGSRRYGEWMNQSVDVELTITNATRELEARIAGWEKSTGTEQQNDAVKNVARSSGFENVGNSDASKPDSGSQSPEKGKGKQRLDEELFADPIVSGQPIDFSSLPVHELIGGLPLTEFVPFAEKMNSIHAPLTASPLSYMESLDLDIAKRIKARSIGFSYLQRDLYSLPAQISMEGFKRKETRAWKEIFDKLDSFITLPSVLYNEDGHVVAIRPDEHTYLWLKRKLSSYFYNAAGLLNGQLYEVPNVPVFDKDGLDPSVAYTPHDYQILCACYRDEVETVLKYFTRIAKIFPSGVEEEEEEAPKPPERPKGAGSSISQAGGVVKRRNDDQLDRLDG